MKQWGATDGFTPRRFGLWLALLILATYPDVVFGGRTFFYRDFGVLAFPTVHHVRAALSQGEWPLWNPFSHCGVPFLAQWGTLVLYPGTLFHLLLPLPWALNLFCLGHLWLAGFGMYWLAARWNGPGLGAAVAGLAFVFNGVTQSCLLWPNYTVALAWMPWVVGLAEGAGRTGGRAIVIAAAAAALQLLAGVPELVAMTWIAAGALICVGSRDPKMGMVCQPAASPDLAVGVTAGRGDGRPNRWTGIPPLLAAAAGLGRPALRLTLALLLALGLAAIQLVPFLDLLAQSQRSAGMEPVKWALPSWGFVNLLVPLFHNYQNPQGLFFQTGQEFFSSVYLGAWLLALAGVSWWKPADRRAWALAGLALFALAMAPGEASPVYRALRSLLPTAGLARYPVKWLVLLAFVVPLLAAFWPGWRFLAATAAACPKPGRAFRQLVGFAAVLAAIGGVAIGFAIRHPLPLDQPHATALNAATRLLFLGAALGALAAMFRLTGIRRSMAAFALLAVLWLDFLTHTPRQNPTLPARFLAADFVPGSSAPPVDGRVFITPGAERRLRHSAIVDPETDFTGKRLAYWSNLNLLDGVAKVNGALTLRLRWQDDVERALYASNRVPPVGVLDFLGVTRQTSLVNVTEWVTRTGALPLITAGAAPVFVAEHESLERLFAPDFNPRHQVLLPASASVEVTIRDARRATVRPGVVRPQRLEFEVESDGPAMAVVAQTFHPNWRATVNGIPARVWNANHAFQAIEVPAGSSRVVLRYVDRAFQSGAALSLVALVACMAGWSRTRADAQTK